MPDDAVREALTKLERAASEVARYGAQTGPQWTKLSSALIQARAALASSSKPPESGDVGGAEAWAGCVECGPVYGGCEHDAAPAVPDREAVARALWERREARKAKPQGWEFVPDNHPGKTVAREDADAILSAIRQPGQESGT